MTVVFDYLVFNVQFVFAVLNSLFSISYFLLFVKSFFNIFLFSFFKIFKNIFKTFTRLNLFQDFSNFCILPYRLTFVKNFFNFFEILFL